MNSLPIIRLEVANMKHSIMLMLAEHSAQLDADMREAVDSFCEPDNLKRIIADAAHKELKAAIEAEVRNFFTFGDGRKAVAEAVSTALLKGSYGSE